MLTRLRRPGIFLLGLALVAGLTALDPGDRGWGVPLAAETRAMAPPRVSAWSEPIPLNGEIPSTDDWLHIQAAFLDRGSLLVVWSQSVGGGATDVFVARSQDGGRSFVVTNLSNTPSSESEFPHMWVDRRSVYVVWEEGTGADREIYLSVSRDQGKTFDPPVNVSGAPGVEDRDPRVIAGFRTVLVVWEQVWGQDNSDIFFSYSRDGGRTFRTPRNLSSTSGTLSTFPQVARASTGREFFVAWEDEVRNAGSGTAKTEIFFTSLILTAQRESLGDMLNVSNTPGENSLNPVLIASQRNIFLAWEEGAQSTQIRTDRRLRDLDGINASKEREVFLAISHDGGRSFLTTNVSNSPGLDSRRPVLLAPDQRTLYLAWEEEEGQTDTQGNVILSTGKTDIWVTRSRDGGVTFLPPQNLSNSFGVNSRRVHLASSRRDLFVVWEEEVVASAGGREILFSRSEDGGENFFLLQDLSRSLGNVSQRPKLVSDRRAVAVLWEEIPRSSRGSQLLLTVNKDRGRPFSQRRGARPLRREAVAVVSSVPGVAIRASRADRTSTSRWSLKVERHLDRATGSWVFRVESDRPVEKFQLEIFDLSGRKVFVQEVPARAGRGELRWPWATGNGLPAARGVYLCRISALAHSRLLAKTLIKMIHMD